ncbi:hypothetical protein [Caudoviricetes sp.]|nr:hypothetical protein [Caudoviricetes sp.]
MASGIYAATLVDVLDATGLAVDWTSTSNKVALYTASRAPNLLTDTAYTATNEVSSAGYTAGGLAVVTPTLVASGSPLKIIYDQADPSWTGVSFTARYADLYADALAGNNLMYSIDFGADFVVVSNTFTLVLDSLGLWQLNL